MSYKEQKQSINTQFHELKRQFADFIAIKRAEFGDDDSEAHVDGLFVIGRMDDLTHTSDSTLTFGCMMGQHINVEAMIVKAMLDHQLMANMLTECVAKYMYIKSLKEEDKTAN